MLGTTIQHHQVFNGIQFVLLGFDPINKSEVSRKLVNGGGVNAGQYGPSCTHVIVDKLVYDDPLCVAARRDGKILVSSLWVDHSFDVGAPVDTTSVMYRPVRDLNGILGAKSLVVCLTGYQREDREDIMTMVELMGAQFSKPLIANKVTHLICYKFEGEKYLLAKKMKRIKLINHRWLEDCLKAWEIVSEADYSKSGYELEMEAEAKDSEEEPEGVTARQNETKIASPPPSLLSNQEVPKAVSKTSDSKVFSNPHGSSNLCEKTFCSSPTQNKIISTSTLASKSPQSEARNVISAMRTASPTTNTKGNTNSVKRLSKFNLSDAINKSSLVQKVNIQTPNNGPAFCPNDEQNYSFSGKRKMDISCGSFELQKTSQQNDVEDAFQGFKDSLTEKSPARSPSFNVPGRKSLSSKGKNIVCDVPISKTSTSETADLDAVQRPQKKYKGTSLASKFDSRDVGMVENVIKFPSAVGSDLQNLDTDEHTGGSTSKSASRKSVSKKLAAPSLTKKNTANKKGSTFLNNSRPSVDDDNLFKHQNFEEVSQLAKPGREIDLEVNNVLQSENMSGNTLLFMDDETEPPEDKDEENKEKHEDGEPENAVDVVMEEKPEGGLHDDENDLADKIDIELAGGKTLRGNPTKKGKKKTPISVKKDSTPNRAKRTRKNMNDLEKSVELQVPEDVKELTSDDNNEKLESREESTPNRARRTRRNMNDLEKSVELQVPEDVKELTSDDNNEKLESREESTPNRARRTRRNLNDMEKSVELQVPEDVCNDPDMGTANADLETEYAVNKKETKKNKHHPSKTKVSAKEVTDVIVVNKKGKRTSNKRNLEAQEENMQIHVDDQSVGKKEVVKPGKEIPEKNLDKASADVSKDEPKWFILAGNKVQRREFQQIIRRLKGRVCRVSHQWSYQATHFIVPDPIRRTEKFFAAAASGRWILKTDYLSTSNQAGKFLAEEPYEWHKNGLSEDGQINLEAPRKWRLLKEKTGHGAFYGMRIVIYGECIAPPLDTLKRAVKAGDGTILATSPPYTRFLNTGIDFAVVSPGMPHVDIWVQEFLKHEIPCVYADYLVEYVCKPGYSLERHVQYDTNVWAERSYNKLKKQLEEEVGNCEPRTPESDDVACEVCGSRDRGDEMLICGDESGLIGCGVGTHIDCCDPPLEDVPEEDWFCHKCSKKNKSKKSGKRKGPASKG
ncbi:hypothetical protein QVD17_41085 [Tagetes erecta]|uniref:BRCT domain-containing protein n=1 Tax=Tagetes erecta TaxID=13708 RepID=A0AAD8JS56_TARER|nr:hypothetical protein QVD17_41085 [Tagetes erecta]